jgi:hypothetical protein
MEKKKIIKIGEKRKPVKSYSISLASNKYSALISCKKELVT